MRLPYLFLFFISFELAAQQQFIVLKKQEVVLRYDQGQDFVYKMRGEKTKRTGFIRAIKQDTIFLWRDTIPLHQLTRVYEKRNRFHNTLGTFLVIAGVTYFLVDQFNEVVVNGNSSSLNESVTRTSVFFVGAGLPLMFLSKDLHKRGRKFRFMTVDPGSPLYLQPRGRGSFSIFD